MFSNGYIITNENSKVKVQSNLKSNKNLGQLYAYIINVRIASEWLLDYQYFPCIFEAVPFNNIPFRTFDEVGEMLQ